MQTNFYEKLPDLSGRRKTLPGSKNAKWKNNAFRGYADNMETEQFARGAEDLKKTAGTNRTAFMSSEVAWW